MGWADLRRVVVPVVAKEPPAVMPLADWLCLAGIAAAVALS